MISLYLRAYVLQQYFWSCGTSEYWLAPFAALCCSVFSPFFYYVSFASLSLFPSFVLTPILFFLAMVLGAGDAVRCHFAVGLSLFTFVP